MAGEGKVITTVTRGSGIFGSLFKFWWKHKVLLFFMFFIVLQVVIIGFQTHNPDEVVSKVGSMLLNPLNHLQETSLQILSQKGFYDASGGVLKGFFGCFYVLWGVFVNLYTVWLWIQLFRWIFIKLNNSERVYGTVVGTIIYILLQMVYLAKIGESIWIPFTAIGNFLKAVPYLIKPVSDLGNKIYSSGF